MKRETYSLSGEVYLTLSEAAFYAGISVLRWRAHVQPTFPPATALRKAKLSSFGRQVTKGG